MKNYYTLLLKTLTLLAVLGTAKLDGQVLNTESFDGTTFVPAGWTHLTTSSSAIWSRITGGSWPIQSPHSGPGEADFNSFTAFTGVDAIITPPFPLTNNTSGAAVSFWMYRDNGYNTTPDKVDVYYNTSASLTGATLLGTVNRACGLAPTVSSNGWYQYSYTIPNTVTSASVYVIFNATSAYGDDIYLDDVSWTSYPTPCAGVPSANSVITPTYAICPNATANLGLSNTYTVGGITYQWQSSTVSPVGPFTPVATATTALFSAPNQTISTYYTALITCANSGGTITAASGQVTVSPVVIKNVPYHEDFEGIHQNNELPNCSWTANNIPSVTQTYINTQSQNRHAYSGSKFAAFHAYQVLGSNYFYTNGMQLNAGVTYSASLMFTTEYYGYTNVTDLTIMLGTTQTTTGLVPIVTASPAASPVYKSLGSTFTVATSGVYYIAIRGTSNGSYGVNYLSWDDLDISAPCALNPVNAALSVSSQTICQGASVNLSISGADTYTWNTGSNASSITDAPGTNTTYSVVGTNTLSGCSATLQSQMVIVNPTPQVLAYSTKPVVCQGQTDVLIASGAQSYVWSNSSVNAIQTVTPNTTTTYSVIGTNSFNCSSTQAVQVMVNPNPTVNITSGAPNPNQMCKGESVTLAGSGAVTYQWASNSVFISSSPAIVSPNTTTTYTLIGTDANGCQGKATITLNVSDCTGINEITTTLSGVKVYPNPTAGIFTIELNTTSAKVIQVTDLTGRVIITNAGNNEKMNVNLNGFANGIYYVKIQSDKAAEVIKVVKQ
jgi:hypothetical protein